MVKSRLTISVDPDLMIHCSNTEINTSGLINNFLRSYFESQSIDEDEHVLMAKLTRLKDEINERTDELAKTSAMLAQIRQDKEKLAQEEMEKRRQAVQILRRQQR